MHSCNVSVVCSLFVHLMFPNSKCREHAQVLSSHGDRLLPFHGWISGGGIPVLASALAGARMARRPGASCIAASSMKASKAATSMVHQVGRAPEHGEGQGIEWKLMARPLSPRCVTIHGHLNTLAIVLLTPPCMTVHGVQQHIDRSLHTIAR